MKRTSVWWSLTLALTSACGDDGTAVVDGTAGATETGEDPGTVTMADAGEEQTGTSSTTGDETTGGADPTGSGTDSTGSTAGETEDTDAEETGGTVDPPAMGVIEHYGGGRPNAVTMAGDYAYVGIGPRVLVWDLADPYDPQLVGRSDALPGLVTGIAIHGDVAYATSRYDIEGELYLLDLADPTHPKPVGTIDYTANPYRWPTDLAIDGTTLFVSDTEVGIVSLDLADPEHPTVIDTLETFGVQRIDIGSGRVRYRIKGFIGGDTVGTAIHVEGVLTAIGEAGLPDLAMDVAHDGDRAYNAGYMGFFAYDLSDPDVAVTEFSDPAIGTSVQALAGVAYNFGNVLTAFDFTGPEPQPSTSILVPTARTTASTIVENRMIGVSEHGFGMSFDVSEPLLPSTEALFDLPVCAPVAVAFADAGIVLADYYTGLRIVDPTDGSTVGRYRPFASDIGMEDVVVVGDLAYVADWFSGMHIVDLSDPSAPVFVNHISTPGHPSSVDVAGNLAFIGESSGGGAVRVIDVSDPGAAQIVGGISTTHVGDLVHRDGLVYVADRKVLQIGGLRIIDVTNPAQPAQIGHYTTCEGAYDVALDGSLAYLVCADDERLHIVDVGDPTAPVLVQIVDLGATGLWSIALSEKRAFVGHAEGIADVDLSDPLGATALYDYPTSMLVRDVAVRGDVVFGIADMGGIYRVDL